jgi:hypothetical protein
MDTPFRIGHAIGYVVGRLFGFLCPPTRSAADPDKETPPPGWCACGNPSTPDVFHRADGPCFHLEAKPAGRIAGTLCTSCGREVTEGETVWMHPATGALYHIRCYNRRRTIRGES